MTERPIFVPSPDTQELVREVSCHFDWHPGFAPTQKKKNITALHVAGAKRGLSPLLEVSTKSESPLGRYLSAFNLRVRTRRYGSILMECAFQGSKIFERGGPYTDLYTTAQVSDAKHDSRIHDSGMLIGFQFEGSSFPLEPKTAFYDWLYINAIYPSWQQFSALKEFAGYTDIEFNPNRSVNCQARSCALFVALVRKGLIDRAMTTPHDFIDLLSRYAYPPSLTKGSHETLLRFREA